MPLCRFLGQSAKFEDETIVCPSFFKEMKIYAQSPSIRSLFAWVVYVSFFHSIDLLSVEQTSEEAFFEANIRPILLGRCVECHGPEKQKNGLRVDSLSALIQGGKSGPAISPGKPEESLLIHAVRRMDEDLKMPPKVPLAKHEMDNLVLWIRNGSVWPSGSSAIIEKEDHWAFTPPRKSRLPADPSGWADAGSAIDRFIVSSMRKKNLLPVEEASPRDLFRRLYFDLVGLPPSPEEIFAFLENDSPTAYVELVDRLLESPRYGERWGRHWLDVARYADTAGDNSDFPIPEARLYRDYVIDSFNKDKPYDEFLLEQLAGDIVAGKGSPKLYSERVIATGFVGLSRRFGTYMDEAPELVIEDTLDVIGRSLMGITLKCARCHAHKYDPVSMNDYYGLYGIFSSTAYPFPGAELSPRQQRLVPASPPEEVERLLKPHAQDFVKMRRKIEETLKTGEAARKYFEWKAKATKLLEEINSLEGRGDDASELRDRLRRIDLLAARAYSLNEVAGLELRIHEMETELGLVRAYSLEDGTVGDARIQKSGDPTKWGPYVRRGFPSFISVKNPPEIPTGSSGRLQLADWLTRPDHPLTARVMVNRIWQWHFGKPLVATPSNFGIRGAAPTHPELLDWLAVDFVEGGWSIKRLHRKILLSNTYRLSSDSLLRNEEIDPGNRLYWRFDRRRLDAETIRDSMLHASGQLNLARSKSHPFPKRKDYKFSQHNPFQAVYPSNHRSVYLMTQRFKRHPFLSLFDGPDTNVSTATRRTSTIPQQALYMMNSDFVRIRAGEFADRVMARAREDSRRIDFAHLLTWGRLPDDREKGKALAYLRSFSEAVRESGHSSEAIPKKAWTSYGRILFCANEFLYVD